MVHNVVILAALYRKVRFSNFVRIIIDSGPTIAVKSFIVLFWSVSQWLHSSVLGVPLLCGLLPLLLSLYRYFSNFGLMVVVPYFKSSHSAHWLCPHCSHLAFLIVLAIAGFG